MIVTIERIEIAFIPLYFVCILASLWTLFNYAQHKRAVYILTSLFATVRMVGNILLVAAYTMLQSSSAAQKASTIKGLFVGGYILELAGTGFVISAVLSLYNRAILYDPRLKGRRSNTERVIAGFIARHPSRLMHTVVSVGQILLIVGIANSTDVFEGNSSGQGISSLAKAGILMLVIVLAFLFIMCNYHLFIAKPVSSSAKTILTFCAITTIPLIARIAWSTYRVFAANLEAANPWASLVLQYICEITVIALIIACAIVLHRRGGDSDLDEQFAQRRAAHNGTETTSQQPPAYETKSFA